MDSKMKNEERKDTELVTIETVDETTPDDEIIENSDSQQAIQPAGEANIREAFRQWTSANVTGRVELFNELTINLDGVAEDMNNFFSCIVTGFESLMPAAQPAAPAPTTSSSTTTTTTSDEPTILYKLTSHAPHERIIEREG